MNDPPEKNVSFVSQPLKPQVHGLIQIPFSLNGNPIQNDEKSLLCIISPRPKRKTDLQIAKSHGRVIKGDAKRSSFKKNVQAIAVIFLLNKEQRRGGKTQRCKVLKRKKAEVMY